MPFCFLLSKRFFSLTFVLSQFVVTLCRTLYFLKCISLPLPTCNIRFSSVFLRECSFQHLLNYSNYLWKLANSGKSQRRRRRRRRRWRWWWWKNKLQQQFSHYTRTSPSASWIINDPLIRMQIINKSRLLNFYCFQYFSKFSGRKRRLNRVLVNRVIVVLLCRFMSVN